MLKRNPGYVKREFAGIPYLIPFGQSIADYEKNIRLNETGAFLWELLEQEKEKEMLMLEMLREYGADEDTEKEIKEDLELFLAILTGQGVIIDTDLTEELSGSLSRDYEIAGLNIRIKALPDCFPEGFSLFEKDFPTEEYRGVFSGKTEQSACFVADKEPDLLVELKMKESRYQERGKILIRNEELIVFEQEEQFLLLFVLSEKIVEAVLSKDGKRAVVYYMPPANPAFLEDFFHAIRFFFLYTAQRKGYFALHSVSLLYKDKAWLFSGHSGMGKTTHTNFWKELLDTPILNGDLNLISIEGEEAVIHGIPWCGTSGIFFGKKTFSLGGIVLLKKVENDLRCQELLGEQKILLTAQRFVSPTWTEEMQECNLVFMEKLAGIVPVWRLEHIKSTASVELIQKEIDERLTNE